MKLTCRPDLGQVVAQTVKWRCDWFFLRVEFFSPRGGGGGGNVGLMHSSGSIELHHFRPSPLCEWDLRSSRTLSSVDWKRVADVSGQPTDPIFRGQTYSLITVVETDWLSRNIGNYQCTLRNIVEERRSRE